MKYLVLFIFINVFVLIYLNQFSSYAQSNYSIEPINKEFTEDFGGPRPGFRFKVRNVQIEKSNQNILYVKQGGKYKITMEILHDCISCGNAINQVIVGLAGEDKAQVSVWNGKQRSGGSVKVVNSGTDVACLCEDNIGKAEWVKVFFAIKVPDIKGIYYIRTRYSQAYTGNLFTKEGLKQKQQLYTEPLNWWKVDRANGPGSEANIAAIVVE